jgi:hypothetical protein
MCACEPYPLSERHGALHPREESVMVPVALSYGAFAVTPGDVAQDHPWP